MAQFYYKKLVSLNPEKYDFIPADHAVIDYNYYLESLAPKQASKSFDEWLTTEI